MHSRSPLLNIDQHQSQYFPTSILYSALLISLQIPRGNSAVFIKPARALQRTLGERARILLQDCAKCPKAGNNKVTVFVKELVKQLSLRDEGRTFKREPRDRGMET